MLIHRQRSEQYVRVSGKRCNTVATSVISRLEGFRAFIYFVITEKRGRTRENILSNCEKWLYLEC